MAIRRSRHWLRAHAGGEVHGGAAVGDFDPAPRAMHVEDNEQVDRSVALVFAVVALELSSMAGIDWRVSPMSWTGGSVT